MATLKMGTDLQNLIKKIVLDTYYPIGKLYLSVGNEDPNNTIGGTWVKISGYYLYADTSVNNTSYTGKHAQSHVLTANQSGLRDHDHYDLFIDVTKVKWGSGGGGSLNLQSAGLGWDAGDSAGSRIHTGGSGSRHASEGHSHNIATKGIFVWQRTA